MEEHPSIDDLQEFVDAVSTGRSASRRVLRHLLARCSSCGDLVRALASSRGLPISSRRETLPLSAESSSRSAGFNYDQAFAKAEQTLSFFLSNGRPVREPPPTLLAALVPELSSEEELPLSRERAAIPALVKWLVQKSHGARYEDPHEMFRWALMARLAADSCSASAAGSALEI